MQVQRRHLEVFFEKFSFLKILDGLPVSERKLGWAWREFPAVDATARFPPGGKGVDNRLSTRGGVRRFAPAIAGPVRIPPAIKSNLSVGTIKYSASLTGHGMDTRSGEEYGHGPGADSLDSSVASRRRCFKPDNITITVHRVRPNRGWIFFISENWRNLARTMRW